MPRVSRRRGYRFVAEVRRVAGEGEALVVETHTVARVVTEEVMIEPVEVAPRGLPASQSNHNQPARPVQGDESLARLFLRRWREAAVAVTSLLFSCPRRRWTGKYGQDRKT